MKNLIALFFLLLPIFIKSDEPVYFIHGFLRSSASMKKMASAFEKQNYEVHLWDYPGRKQNIEVHAESLVKDLQKCVLVHKNEPIHFITHSLGGIILRAALNHPDCPFEAKIGHISLLAPPNQGSKFGRSLYKFRFVRKILGQRSGKQLLKAQNFDHLGQFPSEAKVLVISGTYGRNPLIKEKNDGKVGVSETRLSTPHKHIMVPLGHTWIMRSTQVISLCLDFVSKKTD